MHMLSSPLHFAIGTTNLIAFLCAADNQLRDYQLPSKSMQEVAGIWTGKKKKDLPKINVHQKSYSVPKNPWSLTEKCENWHAGLMLIPI